jgi:hypothetical protein
MKVTGEKGTGVTMRAIRIGGAIMAAAALALGWSSLAGASNGDRDERGPAKPGAVLTGEPEQQLAPFTERQTKLKRADRRRINELLDRFVASAVARKAPGAAWTLVTPRLREGSTKAEWRRGDLPAMPYKPKGSTFHQWRLLYSFPNEVDIELILLPARAEKLGPVAFDVNFKRVGGRLFIDAFDPSATFARDDEPAHMSSVRDVNPGGPGSGSTRLGASSDTAADKPRLGAIWFLVPLGFLALPALAGLIFVTREAVLRRRTARAIAEHAADRNPIRPAASGR